MAAIKIFVIGLACIVVGVEMADIIQFLEALLFVTLATEPCREGTVPSLLRRMREETMKESEVEGA